jgi:hypothetical protein
LLVELKYAKPSDAEKLQELMDSVGELVEEAERRQFLKGYMRRDYILFADPQKPLPRTEKGTISRRAALKLYEKEIDDFYISKGEGAVGIGQRTAANGVK